jgi:hypothetical protein
VTCWFQKASNDMPYLGIGSISGILHIIANFLMPTSSCRQSRRHCNVDRHLELNKGDADVTCAQLCIGCLVMPDANLLGGDAPA